MLIYQPIDSGLQFEAEFSSLVAIELWRPGIKAKFIIPNDPERLLQVIFNNECIIRILDEFPLSIEEDVKSGLVCNNFAYKVSGSNFERTQPFSWKEIFGPVTHYRFVTGARCMDVLSGSQPEFVVIDRLF